MLTDIKVVPVQAQRDGKSINLLKRETPLWGLTRALGEQIIEALTKLGYVRVDELGRVHRFGIKELLVSDDAKWAIFHLDVAAAQLFDPAALKNHQGKPVPSSTLTSDKVVDEIRIRLGDLTGSRVDVKVDNHYYVRYGVRLDSLKHGYDEFQFGDLVDHLDAAPDPFAFPLGLDRAGKPLWLNMIETSRHALLTGTTDGGKTTWMHAAICSLLRRTPPEQLKFAFLDPQKLNFSPFKSLTNYHFTDHGGVLGVANKPQDIVSAMIRLDREHHRRTDLIAATMWGDIEGYNAHVDPGDRLPYVAVFCDELTLLKVALAKLKNGIKDFDLALKSLISGSRKVGFRVFLALQYLHGNTISQEIASQAALTLAFWNSNQGSINTLGDCSASALPGKGRFIVDGLPGGRQTLQGLYIDRETVVQLVSAGPHRPKNSIDDLVLNIITFALNEMDGRLPEGEVARVFADLVSRRQISNLLKALERVGLVLPFNRKTVPPEPRRLKETRLDEIVKVLQFHPEICFRQVPGDTRLRFGPGAA